MAKHRASRYLPGRRSAAWKKIKPARELPGVIVGYWPGPSGVRGVLVAVLCEGRLRYVADLRSGFTDALRRRLSSLLAERVQARPAARPEPGVWCGRNCTAGALSWPGRAGTVAPASAASSPRPQPGRG
jgi:bifunctional non-homologous end joining protein LigD